MRALKFYAHVGTPDVRRLAAIVHRLEVYLTWWEMEWHTEWKTPLSDFQRGYVEAHHDIRGLILGGDLAEFFRDQGEDDLAKGLEYLEAGR